MRWKVIDGRAFLAAVGLSLNCHENGELWVSCEVWGDNDEKLRKQIQKIPKQSAFWTFDCQVSSQINNLKSLWSKEHMKIPTLNR